MAFVNGWSSTRAEGSHYKDIGKGGKRNIRSHSELNLRENIQYDPVKILPSTSTPSLSKPSMHGEKGKGTSNMSTWCHIPFGGPLKGGGVGYIQVVKTMMSVLATELSAKVGNEPPDIPQSLVPHNMEVQLGNESSRNAHVIVEPSSVDIMEEVIMAGTKEGQLGHHYIHLVIMIGFEDFSVLSWNVRGFASKRINSHMRDHSSFQFYYDLFI